MHFMNMVVLLLLFGGMALTSGCSDDSSWYAPQTWGEDYVEADAAETEVLDDAESMVEDAEKDQDVLDDAKEAAADSREAALEKLEETIKADKAEKKRTKELMERLSKLIERNKRPETKKEEPKKDEGGIAKADKGPPSEGSEADKAPPDSSEANKGEWDWWKKRQGLRDTQSRFPGMPGSTVITDPTGPSKAFVPVE